MVAMELAGADRPSPLRLLVCQAEVPSVLSLSPWGRVSVPAQHPSGSILSVSLLSPPSLYLPCPSSSAISLSTCDQAVSQVRETVQECDLPRMV